MQFRWQCKWESRLLFDLQLQAAVCYRSALCFIRKIVTYYLADWVQLLCLFLIKSSCFNSLSSLNHGAQNCLPHSRMILICIPYTHHYNPLLIWNHSWIKTEDFMLTFPCLLHKLSVILTTLDYLLDYKPHWKMG